MYDVGPDDGEQQDPQYRMEVHRNTAVAQRGGKTLSYKSMTRIQIIIQNIESNSQPVRGVGFGTPQGSYNRQMPPPHCQMLLVGPRTLF